MKHDVAVFNRPFRQVAADYLQTQQRRADTGEVFQDRVKNLRNAFKKAIEEYRKLQSDVRKWIRAPRHADAALSAPEVTARLTTPLDQTPNPT